MGDLWCPLVETMRVYLVKFYKIQTAELNKDTSDLHPQTGGGGGGGGGVYRVTLRVYRNN